MKKFKIFENELTKEIQVVKEGWSWPAFLLVCIWAFAKKLWLVGGYYLAITIVVLLFIPKMILVASLVPPFILGLKGNELLAKNLIKRGFVEKDTISASKADMALMMYMNKKS